MQNTSLGDFLEIPCMGAHHPLPLGTEIQAVSMQDLSLGKGKYSLSIHTPKAGGKAGKLRENLVSQGMRK